MIKIRDYYEYYEEFINSITGLKHTVLVAMESDLADKIKNLGMDKFPLLVVIVPSADTNAMDDDNIKENHTCLLYVLKKIDKSSQTDTTFLNVMEETQDIMELIKQKHLDDKANWTYPECGNFLKGFDEGSMHADPEYNYLGCNGWSLSFNINNKRISP